MTFKNSYRFSFLKFNTIIISFLSTKIQTASSRNSNRNDAVFYLLLLRNRRMGLSRWFSREHSGQRHQLTHRLSRILYNFLDRTVACVTRYGAYWTTLWMVGNIPDFFISEFVKKIIQFTLRSVTKRAVKYEHCRYSAFGEGRGEVVHESVSDA